MPRKGAKSRKAVRQKEGGTTGVFASCDTSRATSSKSIRVLVLNDGTQKQLPEYSGWFDSSSEDGNSDDQVPGSGEMATPAEGMVERGLTELKSKIRRKRKLKSMTPGYNAKRQQEYRDRQKRAAKEKATQGMSLLTTYFRPLQQHQARVADAADPVSASSSSSSEDSDDVESSIRKEMDGCEDTAEESSQYRIILESLGVEMKTISAQAHVDASKLVVVMALQAYVRGMAEGSSSLQSSRAVAKIFYGKDGGVGREASKGGGGKTKKQKTEKHARQHNVPVYLVRKRQYRRGAEKIRAAYTQFSKDGSVLEETRGRSGGKTLIHDEDVKSLCRSVISGLPPRWSAKLFQSEVSKKLAERGLLASGRTKIGNSTATSWLRQLGMVLVCEKKGIYKDGHERADVVEARTKYVLKDATDYLPFMVTFGGENMDIVIPAEQYAKFVSSYHDETLASANDGNTMLWTQEDTQDKICSKSKGQTIMVSAFICPCHGKMEVSGKDVLRLKLPDNWWMAEAGYYYHRRTRKTQWEFPTLANVETEAAKWNATVQAGTPAAAAAAAALAAAAAAAAASPTPETTSAAKLFKHSSKMYPGKLCSFTWIQPGVNYEGWWVGEDVVEQMEEVLVIFEFLHPNVKGIFTFDNSTNHGVYPPGALRVSGGCGKGPGGVNAPGNSSGKHAAKPIPKMKDGWFFAGGKKQVQNMHQEDGTFKGMAAILQERGINAAAIRVRCTGKKNGCNAKEFCCCANILSNQPDFLAQRTALEEMCEGRGHICRMLPKFHCEINPIEQFWAWLKVYLRRHCTYSIQGLRDNLPAGIDAVPIATTRRYYRRTRRFEDMYRQEILMGVQMPFKIREYIMKKYKRHRGVPLGVLSAIDEDLNARETLYMERRQRRGTDANQRKLDKIGKLKADLATYKDLKAAAFDAKLQALESFYPFDSC